MHKVKLSCGGNQVISLEMLKQRTDPNTTLLDFSLREGVLSVTLGVHDSSRLASLGTFVELYDLDAEVLPESSTPAPMDATLPSRVGLETPPEAVRVSSHV